MVAWAGCLPMPLLRHHLARFSAKLSAINSSRIPPQHKPPSGAKSGLSRRLIGGSQTRMEEVPRFRYEEPGANLVDLPFRREKGCGRFRTLAGSGHTKS